MPRPKVRAAATDVVEAYVVVRNTQGRYLVRLRGAGERWAGLWDFPRCELLWRDAAGMRFPEAGGRRQKTLPIGEGVPPEVERQLAEATEAQTGAKVRVGEPFAELRHGVTRFRIRLICFTAEAVGSEAVRDGVRWVGRDEFASLALSRTGRQVAERLGD